MKYRSSIIVGKKIIGFSEASEKYSDSQEFPYEDEKVIYRVPSGTLKKTKVKAPIKGKFFKGARVNHSLYGSGFVLESKGFGQDEKVLIKFNDGTKKRFMANFAPLAVISTRKI